MTARDRYTLDLKCPRCGRTGMANVSENDGPWIAGDVGFRIDYLPEGFYVSKSGPTSVMTDISCTTCREVAG